jgi:hypothetical protein
MWRYVVVMLAVFIGLSVLLPGAVLAETRNQTFALPIGEAFEKGQEASRVRMADDGQGVILYDRVLYEDDGPGLRSDAWWLSPEDRGTTEEAVGETRLKKILVIDRPEALEARFCIPKGVKVTVNGQPLPGGLTRDDYPVCPVSLLKQGENEIIIEAPADQAVSFRMAARKDILLNAPERANRPPRSFKSADGGQTWQPIDGELFVRIELVQYVARGTLVSPVIDLAVRRKGSGVLTPALAVTNVALKTASETPDGTGLKFFVRTGTSPAYEAALWTPWQPAETVKVPAGHRYLQWQAELTTADATKTPRLKSVEVEATTTEDVRPAWVEQLRIAAVQNAEFRYTSMPFQYEDPNSPKMKNLRQKYKLDEVVAGGRTEFEKLVLLRNWVSKQWRFQSPKSHYPAWDADEILTLKAGICVQYAIVYMECATALGYQTRFFLGNNYATGHEVTEVWSDDYKKWVFMDPTESRHYVDPRTGTPLSVLEIRDLILATYYEGKTAGPDTHPQKRVTSDLIAACYGTQTTPGPVELRRRRDYDSQNGKFYVPAGLWMVLRYLPRNNFLSQPYPVPLTEGASDWDYPDFWMWNDGRNLTQYRYRNFTARRSDLAWTINEVCFDVAYGAKPDLLAVQMCTVTPYFETFLVKIDDQGWKPSGRTVDWTLHAGANRLEMRVRNTSGVEGPVSFVAVERP